MTQDYADRLRADEWCVRAVDLTAATALVRAHHYARGASKSATYLHGLFRGTAAERGTTPLGVAWWIPPTMEAANNVYPSNWRGVLSLSRLVIHPDVPKNACSFLLSRSMRLICRARWPALLTYADMDWQAHRGTIYRASNWTEAGITEAKVQHAINGIARGRKTGSRTYTMDEMAARGAEVVGYHRKIRFVHIQPPETKPCPCAACRMLRLLLRPTKPSSS